MTKKTKTSTIPEVAEILVGFTFYIEGKEYIVQATTQQQARDLLLKILDNGKRNR